MKILATLFALGLACISTPTMAGDPVAGKARSATCAACHGVNGLSSVPMYPNLAGQQHTYLVYAMKAMRDGQRTSVNAAVCTPMMSALSDTDIDNLAAYYSSL